MNDLARKFRWKVLMLTYRYGLGAASPILPAAGGVAAATGGIVAAAAGPGFLLAGPIGAAVGGLLTLLGVLGVGGGCGQSCIAASNDANAIEAALKANLQAFLSGQIDQATALANFNQLWPQLQQACAQIGGSAGQNCISDRQEGACHYQTSPGGWQQDSSGAWKYVSPGANGSGTTCWNWDLAYRSPIADSPVLPSSSPSLFSGGSSVMELLLFGGVGLLLAEVF
jgi:hypothetical protein